MIYGAVHGGSYYWIILRIRRMVAWRIFLSLTKMSFMSILRMGLFSYQMKRAIHLQYWKNRRTIKREEEKVGRNDPCPCGSGKKYKKCCG